MIAIKHRLESSIRPATTFIRLAPYLLQVSRDPALQNILRSYLGWMPLCLFSEPVRWFTMLCTHRSRFQNPDQSPHTFYVPHLGAAPFQSPDAVSHRLEENFEAIRAEFTQVSDLEVKTPSYALVKQGTWNTFPLMRSAKPISENIERCPKTWEIAQQCPLLEDVRGGVYFSIMYPGTQVKPHCGPSNLKLRYHLTVAEEKGAKIRSGQEWRTWQEGKCLILDDSFEHEVQHTGDQRRVVLIVDCWHPDLNEAERAFLTRLHQIWHAR